MSHFSTTLMILHDTIGVGELYPLYGFSLSYRLCGAMRIRLFTDESDFLLFTPVYSLIFILCTDICY
nr:hypothetical protein [uncultured Prevotella sp.]